MKHIRIPEPITIEQSGEKVAFKDFVSSVPLADRAFGEDYSALMSASKVKRIVADGSVGKWVSIEDADYDRLERAVRTPANPYNPIVGVQLVPFMEAILDASDEVPAPVEMAG